MSENNFDSSSASSFLQFLAPRMRGHALEVRIISLGGEPPLVGFYDDYKTLINDVNNYSGKRNIYIGINPRRSEKFLVYTKNRLKSYGKGAGEKEIAHVNTFFIDIDTVKPVKGVSATQEEVDKAKIVSDNVKAFLDVYGIQYAEGFSGNGWHLLVPTINYSVADAKEYFPQILKHLSQQYSNNDAEIDLRTGDPARLCKLYGSMAIKGENSKERPHRTSSFCSIDHLECSDVISIFKPLLEEQVKVSETREECSDLILKEFKKRGLYLSEQSPNKHLVICPWDHAHSSGTHGDTSTVLFTGEKCGFSCLHSHCEGKTIGDIKKLWHISKKSDAKKLTLTSLQDLFREPEEQIEWLVDNMLPMGGFSIIGGKPKSGKTTLVRQLCLDVAKGERFLDRDVSKGIVIYLAVEEKRSEVKKHFLDMGACGEEEVLVYTQPAPKDILSQLRPIIEHYKPRMIVFDTLFRVVRVDDGNDYMKINNVLEPVLALARETNTHILGVHHIGKVVRDGTDGMLGSIGIQGAADSLMMLERRDDKRILKTQQRYGVDLEPTELSFDTNTRKSTLGRSSKESALDDIQRDILGTLQMSGKMTEKELKGEVSGRNGTKIFALRKLVEDQKLIRTGEGKKGKPYEYELRT